MEYDKQEKLNIPPLIIGDPNQVQKNSFWAYWWDGCLKFNFKFWIGKGK